MYHNYISCQVHSCDKDWFRGKIARIRTFFVAKKPWYALINKVAPFVLPLFVMLPLQFAALCLVRKEYVSAISPLAVFILLLLFSYLVYSNRVFPYVKIVLAEKGKKRLDWNGFLLFVTGVASFFIIIDYFLKFLQFIRSGK